MRVTEETHRVGWNNSRKIRSNGWSILVYAPIVCILFRWIEWSPMMKRERHDGSIRKTKITWKRNVVLVTRALFLFSWQLIVGKKGGGAKSRIRLPIRRTWAWRLSRELRSKIDWSFWGVQHHRVEPAEVSKESKSSAFGETRYKSEC